MNKQFVKHDSSSHWYQLNADGSILPQYEADLRDARKYGYFISPTSIEKDIRANPTLARWIKNEVAKAFVSNPRIQGETDDNYATRCLNDSDRISREAREKGTEVHAMCEEYPSETTNGELSQYWIYLDKWWKQEGLTKLHSEISLANPRIGVAGRCDLIAFHPLHGEIVIDFKTQNVKKKPQFYDSFPRQLAFYADAFQKTGTGESGAPRIMSVVIDTNQPGPLHTKLYTEAEQAMAYTEFLCHAWLWFREKDYWPGTDKIWTPLFLPAQPIESL